MIEPFTSTRKILLLALGIINLVVYHGLITHDSYNILSSRNEPFYYICKILTHSRDRHGGVVHAEPERTSCVYYTVPDCGDHASTELGQGPSRGVVQGDSVSKNFEVLKAKAILARRCHIFKKGEGGLSPEVPYF